MEKPTSLKRATEEAVNLLTRYDRLVLGGYSPRDDRFYFRRGSSRRFRGKIELSLHQWHRGARTDDLGTRLRAVLESLENLAKGLFDSDPLAEAARYFLRRTLADVASELTRRAGHRTLRGGGPQVIAGAVQAVLTDVTEILLPWAVCREFFEALVTRGAEARSPSGRPAP